MVGGGTTNYGVNNLNQYDNVGSVYYDYDLNGNTTFDGVAFYTYDSENRLTGATNADGTTAGPLNPAVDNMDLTHSTTLRAGSSPRAGMKTGNPRGRSTTRTARRTATRPRPA